MKRLKINEFFSLLASPRLTLALLCLFGISIATATFIESAQSTSAAKSLVYNARWFEVMLALFVLNLMFALRRWWPFRVRLMGFVLIHIAVIVILLSAAVTRYFGYEGTMFLREGASSDHIYSRKDHIQVTIGQEKGSFPVRLFKVGDSNVSRDLVLGDETVKVAVTKYWSRFDEVYSEGEGGIPALAVTAHGDWGTTSGVIFSGRPLDFEGKQISYSPNGTPVLDNPPFGSLVINTGSESTHLDIGTGSNPEVEIEGFSVIVREFNADFRLGASPSKIPMMSNPMVRLEVFGPDGSQEERTLFANHPTATRINQKIPGTASNVAVEFEIESEIKFGGKGDGIWGICTPGLTATGVGGSEERIIGAGQLFNPRQGESYRAVSGEFSLTLDQVFESAILEQIQTDDPEAVAVAEIQVTDQSGAVASALVAHGIRKPASVLLGQRVVKLGYGPIKVELPYRLMLDDFVVRTYPGSTNPIDFESRVRLFDDEKDIDGAPSRIYMNHPLNHRGFKHFQSSYDEDQMGTILTVNFDPGKIPTYFGYAIISLGFILVFLKDLIWNSARKRRDSEGGAA